MAILSKALTASSTPILVPHLPYFFLSLLGDGLVDGLFDGRFDVLLLLLHWFLLHVAKSLNLAGALGPVQTGSHYSRASRVLLFA